MDAVTMAWLTGLGAAASVISAIVTIVYARKAVKARDEVFAERRRAGVAHSSGQAVQARRACRGLQRRVAGRARSVDRQQAIDDLRSRIDEINDNKHHFTPKAHSRVATIQGLLERYIREPDEDTKLDIADTLSREISDLNSDLRSDSDKPS